MPYTILRMITTWYIHISMMAVEYENIEVVGWSIILKMCGSFRGYRSQRDLQTGRRGLFQGLECNRNPFVNQIFLFLA
jgi:hypothetical protein